MKQLSEEEIKKWMRGLAEFDVSNRAALFAIFSVFGLPPSMLDVGCGTGIMVKTACALNVEAYGIDILPLEGDYFYHHDLEEPFDAGRKFAMLISIETAEHINPAGTENYLNTLCNHVQNGGLLILTAAQPGQIGDGHVNCQPSEFWRREIINRGLSYNQMFTHRLALAWSISNISTHWLEANLQVFMK